MRAKVNEALVIYLSKSSQEFIIEAMILKRVAMVLSIFLILSFASTHSAEATLGDKAKKAKSRGKVWKKRYGAFAPLVLTNKKGRVIWECWSGPLKMWSTQQAMRFAKKLISPKLRKQKPRLLKSSRRSKGYRFKNGTQVRFLNGYKGRYTGVEVCAPRTRCKQC